MVDTKCKPVDTDPQTSKPKASRYQFDWDRGTWPEFHEKYPDVSKSNYYNLRATYKNPGPENRVIEKVNPTSVIALSVTQMKICERIAKGEPESYAVEAEGVSIQQHLIWMNEKSGPDYPNFVKECLLFAEKRRKDELVDSVVSWKNRAWQSAAWYLERKYPAEWARPENGGRSGNAGVIINLTITSKRSGKDITDQVQVSQTPDSGAIVSSQEPQGAKDE